MSFSPPLINPVSMRGILTSLFTDNARVYYKPHSLGAGGVGTVRNNHTKGKRT